MTEERVLEKKIDAGVKIFVSSLSAAGPVITIAGATAIDAPALAGLGVAGLLISSIYSFIKTKDIYKKRINKRLKAQFEDALKLSLKNVIGSYNKDSYIKLVIYLSDALKVKIENGIITSGTPLEELYRIINETLQNINEVEQIFGTYLDFKKILLNFKNEFYKQLADENINYAVYKNLFNIDNLRCEIKKLDKRIDALEHKVDNIKDELEQRIDLKKLRPPKIILPKLVKGIENLIGRKEDIIEIDKLLDENRPVVLVHAMGGVGKSELCKFYCSKYSKDVGWFDYDYDLKTTLLKIGDPSRMDTAENTDFEFRRIKNHFLNLPNDTILVFDNISALNQEDANLLCSIDCKILLTSREIYQSHNRIFKHYELDFLCQNACKNLFSYYLDVKVNSFKKESIDVLEQIIDLAGRHTLTIELLAKAYDNSFKMDLEGLLYLLKDKGFDIKNKVFLNGKVQEDEFIKHMLILFDISGIKNKKKYIY